MTMSLRVERAYGILFSVFLYAITVKLVTMQPLSAEIVRLMAVVALIAWFGSYVLLKNADRFKIPLQRRQLVAIAAVLATSWAFFFGVAGVVGKLAACVVVASCLAIGAIVVHYRVSSIDISWSIFSARRTVFVEAAGVYFFCTAILITASVIGVQ